MTSETLLTLTHATERDVDLILVEELRCSRAFREQFVAQISALTGRNLEHCEGQVSHSRRRMHSRREIDILLELKTVRGERYAILIENKLDTAEQVQQAESYRLEAEALVSERFQLALTVLVCPQSYAAKASGFAAKFDAVVSYERLCVLLADRSASEKGELALRLSYRAELVAQAIEKSRRGYQPVPLAAVTNFTRAYVSLLRELGIDLPPGPSMLKDAPAESKTMIFAPSSLPSWDFLPQTGLVHQLREGNANICLYGWGDHFSHLAGAIAPSLVGTPYRLVPTINKRAGGRAGLMVVVDTPPIDNLADFNLQRDGIEKGMIATFEIERWFHSKHDDLEKWAILVQRLIAN